MYRISFRVSKSLRYPIALKLAKLAHHFDEHDGIVDVDCRDEQIALLAALYQEVWSFMLGPPPPSVLYERGYFAVPEGMFQTFPARRPPEQIPEYCLIRDHIKSGRYAAALETYYKAIDPAPCFPSLQKELVYLKSVAGLDFAGRDLFCFRTISAQSPLIRDNTAEYTQCLDSALADWRSQNDNDLISGFTDTPDMRQHYGLQSPEDAAVLFEERSSTPEEYAGALVRKGAFYNAGHLFVWYCDPFVNFSHLERVGAWVGDGPFPEPKNNHPYRFERALKEIHREAENLQRERHGLPRIGEGWFSEMHLFDVVRELFPRAEHQARPRWLKPQHLDVFVPDHKVAFEYQGKQHYEAVDLFGGAASLKKQAERDRRKRRLCKKHGVQLVEWPYDREITREAVIAALHTIKTLPAGVVPQV